MTDDMPFGIDKYSLVKRQGAFLPHWQQAEAIYHFVMHLADSLPQDAVVRIREERKSLARAFARQGKLNTAELRRLQRLEDDRISALLDAGRGSCVFGQPRHARTVLQTLLRCHGERYLLHACCIMPNHVHCVVQPIAPHRLSGIAHSWKSVTAHQILRDLALPPPLWQKESFDHIIRSEASYRKALDYVTQNPKAAGLADWPWVWPPPEDRE